LGGKDKEGDGKERRGKTPVGGNFQYVYKIIRRTGGTRGKVTVGGKKTKTKQGRGPKKIR